MRSYFDEYSKSHRHPVNIVIHNICVPLIAWSVLAFMHTISVGESLRLSHIAAALALGFYLTLGRPLMVILILIPAALMFLSFEYIPDLRWVAVAVFALGWIGQFYGHHIEGVRPSFFKDLLFLLIGPMWVLNKLLPGQIQVK